MNNEYLSKSDVVAKGIRGLIQSGELLPGSVLRQRDLADRFRVSPTPVREALRQLESEGFVTNELHRGATVARTEGSGPEENRLIRAQLESLAVDLAATKVTEEDLRNLSEMLEELDSRPTDDPAWSTLDRRFHFAIYESRTLPHASFTAQPALAFARRNVAQLDRVRGIELASPRAPRGVEKARRQGGREVREKTHLG